MTRFLLHITRHPLGLLGTALTTASAFMFLTLYAMELTGFEGGPYLGIVTFIALPAIFVTGLALIPLGIWRRGKAEGVERHFPIVDLNRGSVRRGLLIFLVATLFNITLLAVATFKGVEFADSNAFCGETCHSVMDPEYTAYQRSPHSRVNCVDCHIGPGADWFVKAKLSGAWQVVATTFDLYPRPIPTPVHNLRPARDTCEQCHWPTQFHGDRLEVMTHHQEDEANTPLKTVLLLRVGGVQGSEARGIHWHVDPGMQIRYQSDESREVISAVELTREGQEPVLYQTGDAEAADDADGAESVEDEWRVMDCVDCHNRPTHIYRMPGEELDDALIEGRMDVSLPFLKREGMRLLQEDWPSHDEARQAIPAALREFYGQEYPDVLAANVAAVDTAGAEIANIWATNIHPQMNITWGTYPNHIGHEQFPGCFRCHDSQHTAADGSTISDDCDTCHTVLAWDEEDPAILADLQP